MDARSSDEQFWWSEVRSLIILRVAVSPLRAFIFVTILQNQIIMFREVAGDFSAFNAGLPVENRLEEIRAIPHRSIDVTLERRVWTRVPVELDPYFIGFSEELHLSAERVLLWPRVGYLL